MYLSHGGLGGFAPHLPVPVYLTVPQPSLFVLCPTFTPYMAAENHSKDPEPFVGTPISARFAEVEAEAAPFMNEVMGYSKRSLVDRLVSEHRKRTQPGHTDFSRPEASSSSKAMVSVSGGARPPLHHPVDSFLRQNVHESYQASSGPIRTKKVSTKRSEPYQSSRAQSIEHRNAEASQSTPPPVQPTGKVIPETTADAETNKKNTEGDKPVSEFYRSHVPRVTQWSIQGRKRDKAAVRSWERQNYQQLREWVKRWKGLKSLPSRNQALHCKHMSHGAE